MTTALLDQAKKLSIADRIELAQAIWDTVAEEAGPDDLPLTEAERRVLDARLGDLEANPNVGLSWEEARARLERDR